MRLLIAITVFFIFFVHAGDVVAQPANLLHKSYAEKSRYIVGIMGNDHIPNVKQAPDLIAQYADWARKNGDEELADMLELCIFTDTTFKTARHNGQVEQKLFEFEERANSKKLKFFLADVYNAIGDYYFKSMKKYNFSLEYYLKAYAIYANAPHDIFPRKQEYLFLLGIQFSHYNDHTEALKYLKEAAAITFPDNKFFFPVYNGLGLEYRYLKKYDSSDIFFRRITDSAGKTKIHEWIAIAKGNIGINCYYQRKYDEAIPLLEEDIKESTRSKNNIKNAVNSMCILATIYCEQQKFDKAKELLQSGMLEARQHGFWNDENITAKLYTLLHNIYEAKGDFKAGTLYADSAIIAKDSLAVKNTQLTLDQAREKVEYVEHKSEIDKLLEQKKQHKIISFFLAATIILLFAIGVLLINRQRNRQQRLVAEKKVMETEKLVAEKELSYASVQLESFTKAIHEKNEIIENFAIEIERIGILAGKTISAADNETLIQLQQSTILTDEQWEHFRKLFEKAHAGFLNRLKKKLPDLSPAEIRFMALSKLRLSNKEMAAMLGISTTAIRMNRHRLRKKLNMTDEADLEELVNAI